MQGGAAASVLIKSLQGTLYVCMGYEILVHYNISLITL